MEEGKEQLLKNRDFPIIFRAFLMKIKECFAIVENTLTGRQQVCFLVSALLLHDPGEIIFSDSQFTHLQIK